MKVNNDKLTKEELQYLIEKLSLLEDEPPESGDTLLESPVPGTPQTDLKERLQRSVDEMRVQNEEVPAHLLDLIHRL
jgi:hypothetical protein